MAEKTFGDINILRTITAGRRVNTGISSVALTAQRDLIEHDFSWLRVTNATTQDVVLPDATTLPNGWKQVIDVGSTSVASVNVKTYHVATPVLLKNILIARTYEFILVDNSASAGVWKINFLEEADLLPAERFSSPFNATTDWGAAAGGYYTITVTAATHARGTQPFVTVQELSGSDYIDVKPDRILILANGNTSIRVPEVPDCRFAGRTLYV